MNANEPVAWMETYKGEPNNLDWDKSNLNYGSEFHDVVPLYTHPVKEQYKFGVDWSKDGNAVTVLKICEDGVAEVVFMDYQEATHPVKEQDESFDRTASHMAGEYVSYKAELTDEEIWEVVSLKWWDWEDSFDVTGFARAILRKAQEK